MSFDDPHIETTRAHVLAGFLVSPGGLTFVGPVDKFPEQFLRQALWSIIQKFGAPDGLQIIEAELSKLKDDFDII